MSGGDEFADISPLSRGRWCDADGRRGSTCVHFQRRSFMRGRRAPQARSACADATPGSLPVQSLRLSTAWTHCGMRATSEPFEWRKLTSVT